MAEEKIKIKAWMRQLEVILTSTKIKQKITFGNNWKKGLYDLDIKVEGTKYLSSLKDRFTVTISNLTYKEIVNLISGEYYDIEIKAGYRSSECKSIFKGGVLYISNIMNDRQTNRVVILCASNAVAKFGQKRMNLSMKSGINMYSAISYICKKAGMNSSNVYIDNEFKNRVLTENEIAENNITTWVDLLCDKKGWVVNSDSILGSNISIWDPYRKDRRKIILDNSNIILIGGYPTLDSDGLKLTVMPTISFCPGDTIQIDNSIINIGVTSESEAYKNLGQFMDKDGNYIIYQIDISLSNRSSDFNYSLKCKSKSLWSNLVGG